MLNRNILRNALVVILVTAFTALSCGKGNQSSTSGTALDTRSTLTVDGVSLRVFDESGVPIGNPAEQYSLALAPEADGRSVIVATKTKLNSTACYLELRFNAAKEHPANIQAGSAMQEYNPLVYTGSPEAGVVIAAQVVPGTKLHNISGELLVLNLKQGPDKNRSTVAFTQNEATDPILSDIKIDETDKNKVHWTFKLRGDGNLNLKFDFADFGVVGARYGKEIASNPSSEPADADNKGKVDFPDFGIIGANYNKSIKELKFYRDENPNPTQLVGTLDLSGKGGGTLKLDPTAKSVVSNGFNSYWMVVPGSGANMRLAMSIDEGPEKPQPPTNVVASDGSYTDKISVSWNPSTGASGYRVYRSTAQNGTYSLLTSVTSTLYDDFVSDTSTYWYKISAYNTGGESGLSTADSGYKAENPGNSGPGDWRMFGRDQQHTRRSPFTGPTTNKLKWSFKTGGRIGASPVIDIDGNVYIGSEDKKLYAIDSNGNLKWTFTSSEAIGGTAAIGADGTIYFASDKIYAINPNGTLKWTTDSIDGWGDLTIGNDGAIYVGGEGNLYAFNSNKTLKWKYNAAGHHFWSAPAINEDGDVYLGNDGSRLYSISSVGTVNWSFNGTGDLPSSPAIGADGTIFVRSDTGICTLFAINPNKTLKWSYISDANELDYYSPASPAIGIDGSIYIGGFNSKLTALDKNGEIKWYYSTLDTVNSSPAVDASGSLYFGSNDNVFYALNTNGIYKWSFQTGDDIWSSPAIGADGTVYFGSFDTYLYAIGPGNGK